MIDLAIAALCSYTYSVSPAIQSPYGAAIDRAVVLFEQANVELVEVPYGSPAGIRFEPMPPLMFPRDYGGFTAGPGLVYLRVILRQQDRFTPPQVRNIRTSLVIHEVQHQMGMAHPTIPAAVTTDRPVVPTVPETCEVG